MRRGGRRATCSSSAPSPDASSVSRRPWPRRSATAVLRSPTRASSGRASPSTPSPLAVAALLVGRAGKPLAWNVLRQQARGPIAIFFDADVWFAPDAFRLLRDALAAAPEAALASGKTTCAPRPRAFERIMAAPYGV